MILGRSFFVTPSDSVAIIAANAQEAIPYFQSGPKVGKLFLERLPLPCEIKKNVKKKKLPHLSTFFLLFL